MSAYNRFVKENMSRVKSNHPNYTQKELMSELGKMWATSPSNPKNKDIGDGKGVSSSADTSKSSTTSSSPSSAMGDSTMGTSSMNGSTMESSHNIVKPSSISNKPSLGTSTYGASMEDKPSFGSSMGSSINKPSMAGGVSSSSSNVKPFHSTSIASSGTGSSTFMSTINPQDTSSMDKTLVTPSGSAPSITSSSASPPVSSNSAAPTPPAVKEGMIGSVGGAGHVDSWMGTGSSKTGSTSTSQSFGRSSLGSNSTGSSLGSSSSTFGPSSSSKGPSAAGGSSVPFAQIPTTPSEPNSSHTTEEQRRMHPAL
ncbi:hypothetical protein BJ684DRAFT_19635 [Piptocephalis cylindrospora]|uniref:YABBY protein C-terminal domain-containing protein n=1 Tax=Piptocephalis cylindrospora TaxID=1907219 RepID=A0A4P9Y532_9FUNG|nr:hypothetical protein BJ684DRAFT_19635 [Piptocephalis cylindrospora]|eukprot:RKP13914.1 hypothetical protein BJ684DRAFT_19635 [Piptocephalis cylindrospora]